MLDALADINGLSPAMYRLSEKQQLLIGNQITELLKSRIGSWEKIDDLITGDLFLADLHEDISLAPLSKSIESILDAAKQKTNQLENIYA